MPSLLLYKVGILVTLVALGSTTTGLVYYYQNRTTVSENQVASQNDTLKQQLDNLTSQVNLLSSEIHQLLGNTTNLQSQIQTLQAKVNQLQSQVASLQDQNTALQAEILQLQSQLNQLQAELANSLSLCSSGKTLVLGELTDLSSALSIPGTRAKDGSLIGVEDVNSFLLNAGCNLRFSLAVEDYQLDNTRALTDLQSLVSQGAQVVVGPLNSGAAQYILTYADSNHIVLISPSSTSASTSLAIPNDYLFRTAPDDSYQGIASARMMIDRGALAVIIVQRHDSYGDNLAAATATRFAQLGGTVVDKIQYDAATTDFTTILTALNNDYNTANIGANVGKVALDFVSFEEFGQIIIQASQQHPSLLSDPLPWFGTDGEAQDTILTSGGSAGLIAQVKLPSTVYSFYNNTKTLALYSKFAAQYPGQACDAFCTGAYDDVWLAALATLQAGAYDGAKIQSVMISVASNYYGVTGWNGLDPNGDRIAQAFQIWKVVSQGSGYAWVLAGTYDALTDNITWNSPP